MTNGSPDKIEIEKPANKYDTVTALTIKVFVSTIFTVGAIVTVLVAVGFVFGFWSTMDQDLATSTANVN